MAFRTGYATGESPGDHEMEAEDNVSDSVSAFFHKTQPGGGKLKADYSKISADGEVVAESTIYVRSR